MLLQLEEIVEGLDKAEEITEIEDNIFRQYKPCKFDGPKSIEVEYNKQFESACLIIAQQTSLEPKRLTVLQFYSALEDIKKQLKAQSKYNKYANTRR